MKNLVALSVFTILFTYSYAQSREPCFPDGINFISQEMIDNFQTDYPNCTEIEGNVMIAQWPSSDIKNLYGLSVLTAIGGWLSIFENDSLTSLTGLEGLTSLGGDLDIGGPPVGGMPLLTSLTGLDNLTSIGGSISIFGNDSLTSLTGLENIDAASISQLHIYYNPLLSICEVQSICDYLAAPNGVTIISNNATGCNSVEEVEEACEAVIIDEINWNNDLNPYPNPFTTSTTIEYTLNSPQTVSITFYDSFGRVVDKITQHQQQGNQKVIWTPEGLNEGIYYFRVEADQQIASGKVLLMR